MLPLRDVNPSHSTPILTWLLIAANVGVFWHYHDPALFEEAIYQLGYIPAEGFSLEKALTSMFMHGGWGHLFFNMWTLWVFGDNVEDALGKVGYALLYVSSGIGAVLTHAALYPFSETPIVGASGAISGVMGAYLVLYPRAEILTWVPPWFLTVFSARFFLVLWFVLQLLQGIADQFVNWIGGAAAGIAFWAHVGGFAVGWMLSRIVGGQTRERLL
ncbi:MAG: rhomboid family intramembrane serine protease [Bacteroidia bacterium]|nr:MAG: rhomboid family intramembrane serine protease [Bacteroidia bacterium]